MADTRPGGARALLRLARPYRTAIVVGMLFGVVGSLGALAQPMAARLVLNNVAEGASLVVPFAVLATLMVVGALASGLQVYILERTGERVVLTLRKRLIMRLLRLRVAEYDQHRAGDLLSRVGSDTTLLRSVLTANVLEAAPSVLTVVGAVALMIYLDWILFVTLVVVLAVASVVVVPALTRINTATRATQDHVGAMTADLERALGAVRTVKASLMEAAETRRVGAHADRAFAAGVRVVKYDAIVGAGTGLALQASFLIILGVGGYRVAAGALGVADLIAFVLYDLPRGFRTLEMVKFMPR
ncbi:ABC transporter ATP-binding protein [Rhodococcus sp. H29-C3]|uniref:ABC transporter ATP-binding protein n=1 Tax=Rhodococcus sp. H29-C3 TaxID=3046307 RepID=UPI0024B87A7D|nr:ABC transporter ATP-binding protein [Rhodococcus sp. H29-C3]MDJ0363433.1 ABC transporter ATP-binding protein [Rhodococcus sp. H29-C3]